MSTETATKNIMGLVSKSTSIYSSFRQILSAIVRNNNAKQKENLIDRWLRNHLSIKAFMVPLYVVCINRSFLFVLYCYS